ncbi:hypothetical protein [Mycobacterium sp.]|uniref:hypothetical protein n=1 Tax=Mycobacterium sp. TaxID=1785 RepID=UPI003C736B70
MTIVAEPVCPAMIEAAAIVEAEWIRLRRPSRPVRLTGEIPASRRCRRRARTTVTAQPPPRVCSTSARELGFQWPICMVLARQRSPPTRT